MAIIKATVKAILKCDEAIQVGNPDPAEPRAADDPEGQETLKPWSPSLPRPGATHARAGGQMVKYMQETNSQFYHIFYLQMQIVELFYQMKVLEIEATLARQRTTE